MLLTRVALGHTQDRRPLEGPRPQPLPLGTAPNSGETVRPPPASPLTGSNIPAYLSATAPTPPLPPSRGGPLQQSRAVARARAARNAHAAVMQAGIQARAQQALSQLQDLHPQQQQRRAEASSTASTPRGGASTGAARGEPAKSSSSSALALPDVTTAAGTRSSQSPGGAAATETGEGGAPARQRPRMRHRPSEPPMAPETVSPRPAPPAAAAATAGTPDAEVPSRTRDGARRFAAVSSAPPAAGAETSRPRPRSGVPDTPPSSASASTSTARPTSSSSQTGPDVASGNFVLPPLNLSDPSLLEDHLSLGLLDPAMLLMSPPPAYTGRASLSSTRSMSTIGQNMGGPARSASERSASPSSARGGGGGRPAGGLGLAMEPIRDDRQLTSAGVGSPRYSMPPSEPPPPPHARMSPPPPLSSSSEGDRSDSAAVSSQASPAASASSSSDDDDDDDDDDDASSFEVTSTDPLVLAWEADRSAGIYSLDERIARDLERRRMAAAQEEDAEEEEGTEEVRAAASAAVPHQAEAMTTAAGRAGGPAFPSTEYTVPALAGSSSALSATRAGKFPATAAEGATATDADEQQDLALLRRRISHAEASNNSRGVVRALSVHATRSLRAQGRVARERRGRVVPPPESLGGDGGSPVAETIAPPPVPVTETIPEREEVEPGPEGSSAVTAAARPPAGPVEPAGPSTVSEVADIPARSLSLRGHRMLAEAAERRMRAEKENQRRTAATVDAPPTVPPTVPEEEAEDEAEEGGSAPSASASVSATLATGTENATSSPPPTPPRPRVVPPPPPPRSRPLSSDRSPVPAFTSSTPSIAWGAAALPTQASLRRPTSIRRAPPPPPPNAAEILAARRASLRPVTSSPTSAGAGAASASTSALASRLPPIVSPESPAAPRNAPTTATQTSSDPNGPPEASPPRPQARPSSAPIVTASALAPAVPVVPAHIRCASVAPLGSASSPSPPRRRPLPTPPGPLGDDRIDAFTALRRQSEGFGGSSSAPSSPTPVQAPVFQAQPQRQQEQRHQLEEEPSAPGPPLPRRPPRREPPAPPVATSASTLAATSTAEVETALPPVSAPPLATEPSTSPSVPQPVASPPLSPGLSMYTDLDLLLARLESQENGTDVGTEVNGASRNGSAPRGGQNYEVRAVPLLSTSRPVSVSHPHASEKLTVSSASVEIARRTCSCYRTYSVKQCPAVPLPPSSPRR